MATEMRSLGRWSLVPKQVKKQLLLSFYLTLFTTLAATVYYFLAQPELPFFYTMPLQEEALGAKEWLFLFPITSFLITLLHMIVISLYQDLETLLLKLFASMTAIIQVVLFLALARIVLITI